MTFMNSTQTTPIANTLRGTLADVGERWTQYRTYRRTLAELSVLSNRDLADLGLHRSALRGIAWKATYGTQK